MKGIEFVDLRTRQDTYLWISLLKRGIIANGYDLNMVKYRLAENSISSNKFKSAKVVWHLYYDLEILGFFKSSYYYFFYIFNALKSRFSEKDRIKKYNSIDFSNNPDLIKLNLNDI